MLRECGIPVTEPVNPGRAGSPPPSVTPTPSHPGEMLRGYLAGHTMGQVAMRLGVTRQALSAVVNGRAGVSASMALKLEAQFGVTAERWLQMQLEFDLYSERRRSGAGPASKNNLAESVPPPAGRARVPAWIVSQHEPLARLCKLHRVQRLALVGSVLRLDFNPDAGSVEVAVSFFAPVGVSASRQYFDFKQGLENLFHRSINLVEFGTIRERRLKGTIEGTEVTVYVEAVGQGE